MAIEAQGKYSFQTWKEMLDKLTKKINDYIEFSTSNRNCLSSFFWSTHGKKGIERAINLKHKIHLESENFDQFDEIIEEICKAFKESGKNKHSLSHYILQSLQEYEQIHFKTFNQYKENINQLRLDLRSLLPIEIATLAASPSFKSNNSSNRIYYIFSSKQAFHKLKHENFGINYFQSLDSSFWINQIEKKATISNSREQLLLKKTVSSIQIYTDLPKPLLKAFLRIQRSKRFSLFYNMGETKVIEFLTKSRQLENERVLLSEWNFLGWHSSENYKSWLKQPMRIAFGADSFYFRALRVWNPRTPRDAMGNSHLDRFELVNSEASPDRWPDTPIVSVSGFELETSLNPIIKRYLPETLSHPMVKKYFIVFNKIISIANSKGVTDVPFIPFEMDSSSCQVMSFMLEGISQAIKMNIIPVNIRFYYCGRQKLSDSLMKVKDLKVIPVQVYENNFNRLKQIETKIQEICNDSGSGIQFLHLPGIDAYSLTNYLQYCGKNTFMLNPRDDNWETLWAPKRAFKQLGANPLWDNKVENKYLNSVTLMGLCSAQNLIYHPNLDKAIFLNDKLPSVQEEDNDLVEE